MKKSFIIGKKQIVIVVLILCLGLAVFFNWKLSSNSKSIVANSEEKSGEEYLGAAQYVNKNVNSVEKGSEEYFGNMKEERESARKAEKDSLNEIVSNLKSDDEAKKKANDSLIELSKSIETESNIETLLKAKKFTDCLVIVNGQNVTVIVKTEGLLGSETVQIQDIVRSQMKISLENIKIVEVN